MKPCIPIQLMPSLYNNTWYSITTCYRVTFIVWKAFLFIPRRCVDVVSGEYDALTNKLSHWHNSYICSVDDSIKFFTNTSFYTQYFRRSASNHALASDSCEALHTQIS